MITAQQIKPNEKGKSDFFSWQLYRWARKRPHSLKIWAGTWNCISGIDSTKTVLYIGGERNDGWIHARQLRNLCSYGANLERWAYGPAHDTSNWVDVTEQFLQSYLKIGVCAIHGDFAHNWSVTDDKRICIHCEKVEKKEIRQIETEVWVAA